jgi:glycosyltransferase involved in cell wall biosynthesis
MKKILYIINSDWFFISHRLPIALEAIKQGYEVHLATNFIKDREKLNSLGIHTHHIRMSRKGVHPLSEIITILDIIKIIKSIKPTIVHGVALKAVLYGGLACKLLKVHNYVASIAGLGSAFTKRSFKNSIIKTAISLLFKISLSHKSLIVIFQNKDDRNTLLQLTNIKESKTLLIEGSGVDLVKYQYKAEPLDKPIITMAARLIFEKGVKEFIEAARIIKAEKIDATFWLVGDIDEGNPSSATREDISSWKKEGTVEILGAKDNINEIFSQSHFVVLPSYYGEGLPKVLIEAAASGRAVITTDNPGCRDAIVPNVTGFLVPIKNAKLLAEKMKVLIHDEQLRRNMGQAGRTLAENKFGIEKVVEAHMKIYEGLHGRALP